MKHPVMIRSSLLLYASHWFQMKAIPYKGVYIFVKVQPKRTTRNKFKVAAGIYQNPKETPVMRSWLAIKEFASEEAAYEFGLQEARAWIDEHD